MQININLKRLLIQMNRYLKSIEVRLNDWRMSIAANKCSFTIYSRKIPKILTNGEFKLYICLILKANICTYFIPGIVIKCLLLINIYINQ